MTVELTSDQVWEEIEKQLFAVLGMVNASNEARTVGIVYVVRDRRLYIGTDKDAWKVRYVAQNPHVSLTVPVHKSIPLMPWMKIPAATITFSGEAKVLEVAETSPEILEALFRGITIDEEFRADSRVIEVVPIKAFLTYGIGVSLMQMRDTELARGRVPVGVS